MAIVSKNFCFTINNHMYEDWEALQEIECRYMIFGEEEGETGTPHIQGYVVFNTTKRIIGVSHLMRRAHIEIAKGSSEQNIAYCSKGNNIVEIGDRPRTRQQVGAAEKDRWEAARTAAQQGLLDDIPADIYTRFYRTLKEIKKDHMRAPQDADDTTGVWIWGPPECGKSRRARAEYPDAYKKAYNKWWDGYQNQDYVILDDFENDKALGHHLKIWGDRYSFIAETKGGALHIRPKKIIVTSNYSIDTVFGSDSLMCSAVKRRYVEIDMSDPIRISPNSVSVSNFVRVKPIHNE